MHQTMQRTRHKRREPKQDTGDRDRKETRGLYCADCAEDVVPVDLDILSPFSMR